MFFDLEYSYSGRKIVPTTGITLQWIGSIKGDIIDIFNALEDPEQDARNITMHDPKYEYVKRYYLQRIPYIPNVETPWDRRRLLIQLFGKPEIP